MLYFPAALAQRSCPDSKLTVQVLGSGGPELIRDRASASYLIRWESRARFLLDAGGGSAQNFAQSGAHFETLEALLLSHLHVDHVADLPRYLKAAWFGDRKRDLPVFGPGGNARMPATSVFVERLFSADGAWPYLADFLDSGPPASWKLRAHDIDPQAPEPVTLIDKPGLTVSAIGLRHGPIPALAWRIDAGTAQERRAIVFSGDFSGRTDHLIKLARNADLLIAHNAVPENAGRVALNLHAPPSRIGEIAAAAKVEQLVLSHRMHRSLGREEQTLQHIRKHYPGPVHFANDLDCF